MTRRELLVGAGAAGVVAGCGPVVRRLQTDVAPAPPTNPLARRLLDRVHYGPSASDAARLTELGPESWLDEQLKGDRPEPFALKRALASLDVEEFGEPDIRDRNEDEILNQLQTGAIMRAVLSPNGLRARMDEHWADHFNVYARKGLATFRLASFRKGIGDPLGPYPAILRAATTHPAMLAYLDGQLSDARHPNENLARELLELHALGADAGYSQKDVMETARALTGWTLETRPFRARGTALFVPERHDDGPKTILGKTIPAGLGAKDREAVLEIVTAHPACARHLARRLAERFLGERAPRVEARMVAAYGDHGREVRAMLRPLLRSAEFREGSAVIKRPFETVVSAVRALGARTDGGPGLLAHVRTMGQATHEWPMPDGYPVEAASWEGSALPRWRFALALARNEIGGTETPAPDVPALLKALHPGEPGHPALRHPPADGAALLLMDPRFAWT